MLANVDGRIWNNICLIFFSLYSLQGQGSGQKTGPVNQMNKGHIISKLCVLTLQYAAMHLGVRVTLCNLSISQGLLLPVTRECSFCFSKHIPWRESQVKNRSCKGSSEVLRVEPRSRVAAGVGDHDGHQGRHSGGLVGGRVKFGMLSLSHLA